MISIVFCFLASSTAAIFAVKYFQAVRDRDYMITAYHKVLAEHAETRRKALAAAMRGEPYFG